MLRRRSGGNFHNWFSLLVSLSAPWPFTAVSCVCTVQSTHVPYITLTCLPGVPQPRSWFDGSSMNRGRLPPTPICPARFSKTLGCQRRSKSWGRLGHWTSSSSPCFLFISSNTLTSDCVCGLLCFPHSDSNVSPGGEAPRRTVASGYQHALYVFGLKVSTRRRRMILECSCSHVALATFRLHTGLA